MATLVKQVDLPYTPRQMFDLVADIESYPSFLRHVEFGADHPPDRQHAVG